MRPNPLDRESRSRADPLPSLRHRHRCGRAACRLRKWSNPEGAHRPERQGPLGGASEASAWPGVGLVRDRGHLAALQVLYHDIAIRELALEKLRASMATSLHSRCERGLPSTEISNCAPCVIPANPLRLPAPRPARRGKFQPSSRMARP